MPQSVNTLSDRDAALLRAVQDHAGPDGWARPRARAALMEAAGLTRTTWQRRARGLVLGGFLEQDPAERAGWSDQPTAYRLTAEGRDAASRRGPNGPTGPGGPRENGPTGPRNGPPLRESPSLGSERTSEESLSLSSGGPNGPPGPTEPRAQMGRVGHDDAARWPHGYLTVPLSADPEENAALMAALAEFYRSRKSMKLPMNPSQTGPVADVPKPEPTRPPPREDSAIRAGWGQISEACQYEFQLPKGHLMGAEGVWIGLHATPGEAPTAKEVLEALRVMVPQWRAKAAASKDPNPWHFVPLLKTWLRERGWQFAAPPAPAPCDSAPAPILGPVEKGEIEELRKKGNAARNRGDFPLANDYQARIDRIRKTGRVA